MVICPGVRALGPARLYKALGKAIAYEDFEGERNPWFYEQKSG